MLKTKKIILGIVLGVLMALCLIVGITGLSNSKTVRADEEVTTISGICGGTTWEYNTVSHTITFSPKEDAPTWQYGWMGDYERYEDTPWHDAGVPEDEIENVIIKEGIVKVGNNAFEDCGGIRSISLPKSLHTIGYYAFDYAGHCHNEEIQMGTIKLPLVGGRAFYHSNITGKVIMQDGWYGLGEYAFSGSRITEVYIGKQGKGAQGEDPWWETYAFYDCDSIVDVTFGEGLTFVREGTFQECSALRSIEFPKSMKTIEYAAFTWDKLIERVYYRGSDFSNNVSIASWNDYLATEGYKHYNLYENWTPKYYDGNKTLCQLEKDKYQILTSESVLNGNWWLVRSNTEINHTLEVTEDSTIVLLDDCKLKVNASIHVHPGKSLYIVSESFETNKMGSLEVLSRSATCAGIGGDYKEKDAKVFICGGKIKVNAQMLNMAGIGSGISGDTTVTIYDGDIEAYSGDCGAGIGSGLSGDATVTIYNGNIKAYGGDCGAGIGSGFKGDATVTIYNGNIKAKVGISGAGIGSGRGGDTTVIIYDGDIEAAGGNYGAGIGSGECYDAHPSTCSITLYGGKIKATGGDYAADIGAGYRSIATVNDYRSDSEPNGLGMFMSGGSIVIICVAGGVALITAGVFMFLYFRKKKD